MTLQQAVRKATGQGRFLHGAIILYGDVYDVTQAMYQLSIADFFSEDWEAEEPE